MMITLGFLFATIFFYYAAKWCYRRTAIVLLSPLLTVPIVLMAMLVLTKTPYETYHESAQWLSKMLEPATIAFAIPLYKHFQTLKKYAAIIIISVLSGSVMAVCSSMVIATIFQLQPELIESLIPRSVTTPIAMEIAKTIGGIPTITAVFVIFTGLLGSIIGPWLIRYLKIENDIARGVLLGTAAHAAGTAKAFEFSSVSGTISSLAMILAALITLLFTPWLLSIIL